MRVCITNEIKLIEFIKQIEFTLCVLKYYEKYMQIKREFEF